MTINFPRIGAVTYQAGEGFGPPKLGRSVVNTRFVAFAFNNPTVTITLPKGAEILSMELVVTTAFNGSGTNPVVVGTSVTANRFWASTTITAVGVVAVTNAVVAEWFTPLTVDTPMIVAYSPSPADATTGTGVFRVIFVIR